MCSHLFVGHTLYTAQIKFKVLFIDSTILLQQETQ